MATEPLLDDSLLRKRLSLGQSDDAEFIDELLVLFVDKAPSVHNKIKEVTASGAMPELQKAAHNLKGICGNICATRLQSACEKLEDYAAQNNSSAAQNFLTIFETISEETLIHIQKIIEKKAR